MIKFSVYFILFFLCQSIYSYAQEKDSTDYTKKKEFNDLEERKKVKYRLIPLPSYDPSTKWGLSLMGMANYYPNPNDLKSPPSMTGVFGYATTNGSWGVGAMQNLNLKEDHWRIQARVFYMSINQELQLGELGLADSKRKMTIAFINAKYRAVGNLFLGLGYSYKVIDYEGRDAESQGKLEMAGFANRANNHGLRYMFSFDNRDNIFYAYKGWMIDYTLLQNFSSNENTPNDFLEHRLDFRQYNTLAGNTDHVLAWHFYNRILTGNPTNENYSYYGRAAALIQRGYEVGTFIDKNMTNLELEYRRETPWMKRRFGFIVFASIGKVYGDYFDFGDAEWLPAGGAGVRYRFMEYERMNLKCDVGYGKEGWTVYFGMNEAF